MGERLGERSYCVLVSVQSYLTKQRRQWNWWLQPISLNYLLTWENLQISWGFCLIFNIYSILFWNSVWASNLEIWLKWWKWEYFVADLQRKSWWWVQACSSSNYSDSLASTLVLWAYASSFFFFFKINCLYCPSFSVQNFVFTHSLRHWLLQ